MKSLLTILVISIVCFGFKVQNKTGEKKLTENIAYLDFLTITIKHGVERYSRKEINIIYHHGNKLKIHSVLKSNGQEDIDTAFVLNGAQLMLIDQFGEDFKNNKIDGNEGLIAGTRTFYYITLKDSTSTLSDKTGYSLIADLLKK